MNKLKLIPLLGAVTLLAACGQTYHITVDNPSDTSDIELFGGIPSASAGNTFKFTIVLSELKSLDKANAGYLCFTTGSGKDTAETYFLDKAKEVKVIYNGQEMERYENDDYVKFRNAYIEEKFDTINNKFVVYSEDAGNEEKQHIVFCHTSQNKDTDSLDIIGVAEHNVTNDDKMVARYTNSFYNPEKE